MEVRRRSYDGSPSPPPAATHQPLTKRDVRRNRIMERLEAMMNQFDGNQNQHYRAQLQAVQVDMTMVVRADPYEETPLPDDGEWISEKVEETVGAGTLDGYTEEARTDFRAMAGKRYAEFATRVNDSLEKRDAELTALHDHYNAAVAELERLTQQKLHQAGEEHKALSNTVRQRLIASITKRRQHLMRDKEQLDIADSNALLLHPNHFSINNPGSPGGGQNRKTRHLRHRATSPSGEMGESGKRKRKAAALEDEGNESPAPAFRPLPPPDALGGGRSPFKDAREKKEYAQYEAPAYSLERIFTDKELAMATSTAQQATYRHFHQPRQPLQEPASNGNGTGTNVPSITDGEVLPDAPAAEGDEAAHPTTEAAVGTPPPSQPAAAPEMERSTSHQVLTRGGARANPLAALSELANAATASGGLPNPVRDNPFAPVVPTYHAVSRAEKLGAPAPPPVSNLDIENDFEMIRRAADPSDSRDDPDEPLVPQADGAAAPVGSEMRRQLLDQALGHPTVTQPYRLPLLETGPAIIPKGVDRPSYTGFAMPAQYEEQKRKQMFSNFGAGQGGFGNGNGNGNGNAVTGGSLAQALKGTLGVGVGGEPMSRTTSAGGSEVGAPSQAQGTFGGRRRVV
jgi:hypothetical protein